MDNLDLLFVVTAFLFIIVLLIHFTLRKWRFRIAMRYGWMVYILSIPAVLVSVFLYLADKPWSFWLGGLLYFVWAVFGYTVEYRWKIQWRSPIRWLIFGPYVILYLATNMFYWFPLALIRKPLWYVYAVLFILSTVLNVSSHKEA